MTRRVVTRAALLLAVSLSYGLAFWLVLVLGATGMGL